MLILNCLDTKNKHSTSLDSTNINKYMSENLIQTDILYVVLPGCLETHVI